MKIPGTITTSRRETIEVDKEALYRELLRKYRKVYDCNLQLEFDYINSATGVVMKYDGDNHHNGDPEFVKLRIATEADIDAFRFKEILVRILL